MTDDVIDHAIKVGRLHRVFRGAYAVGHPHRSERSRLMAAVLACGKGAVVSHRSAAALLELIDKAPVVIDVIAPPSRGRKIDGVYLHHVRPPRLEETGTFDGIPCTSPSRTLVDLAGVVGEWTLRIAFERAARRETLDLAAIERSIDPRRRGMKVLLGLIEGSRDFHGTAVAFERDRWRDRELMRAGYAVLRVTNLQAEREADEIAATVAARLSTSAGTNLSAGAAPGSS